MGRHSASPPPRRTPIVAAASAILLLGAGGGYALVRNSAGNDAPATAHAGAATSSSRGGSGDVAVQPAGVGKPAPTGTVGCAKGGTVKVSTTPDIAPALTAVARSLADQGSNCVRYEVTSVAAGIALAQMTQGKRTPPQIWVPDSKAWLEAYNALQKTSLGYGDVVATSPVALALPKRYVDAGAPVGAWTWAEFLSSRHHAATPAMADPEYSTASMLLLASAHQAVQNATMAEAVKAEVGLMARNPRDEVELMSLASQGSPLAATFPASEQQMLAQHAKAPNQKVSAVTVAGGTPQFTYGVVPMAGGDDVTRAADALRDALRSPSGRKTLQHQGFRVPGTDSATAPSAVDGLLVDKAGQFLADPDPKVVDSLQKMWIAIHRRMRLLLAVDESGSMLQPATKGLNRIQLATGVSLRALKQLNDDAEVGVWTFSTGRGPQGQPWAANAPIKALSAADANGRTHRDNLVEIAQQLPALPRGGTALYDTILAAVRQVQQGYDPNAVNSVVVWTDGVNRDAATMSKEQLLAELKVISTGDKPVRVILVGMGQKSDMRTLQQIAAASGGSAYYALDPTAIESVIAGALYARIEESGSAAG